MGMNGAVLQKFKNSTLIISPRVSLKFFAICFIRLWKPLIGDTLSGVKAIEHGEAPSLSCRAHNGALAATSRALPLVWIGGAIGVVPTRVWGFKLGLRWR